LLELPGLHELPERDVRQAAAPFALPVLRDLGAAHTLGAGSLHEVQNRLRAAHFKTAATPTPAGARRAARTPPPCGAGLRLNPVLLEDAVDLFDFSQIVLTFLLESLDQVAEFFRR